MKTTRHWTVAAAMTAAGVAMAENYVWNGGGADAKWTTAANWYIQTPWQQATECPKAGDVILVGKNVPMPLDLSDAESVGVLNSVTSVQLTELGSIFNVSVPSGADVTIHAPIRGGSGSTGNSGLGQAYFTGSGVVRLAATNLSDYCMNVLSANGADMWLPQNGDLQLSAYQLGSVTVTNGATLHMPTRHDGNLNTGGNYVQAQRLYGDGSIAASENTELRFGGSGGVFAGTIAANVRLFSGGVEYLTGTNSPMNWNAPRIFNAYTKWSTGSGVLGVMKFGKAGENSSIGKIGEFQTNVRGGTYLYLGAGEETDKYLSVYANADGYATIDGGACGGLAFTGAGGFYVRFGSALTNGIVGLNGSNTTACVFRGKCREVNSNFLATVVKKGTGTWRFANPDPVGYMADMTNRTFRGSISVDEGVLQFDTVSPPGECCSVGLATVLKGPKLGAWTTLPAVEWAFSLGGTNAALNALAEGTLEYTGTMAGLCDRRKVRLEADGRFRANGAKKIRYRMAAPTLPREKKLTLDGSSAASNEVHDVTDNEAYPVSVVKEGTGTWVLGGDQSFHGDLAVKGGKLIVRKHDAGSNYTWFRFTVKDMFDPVNVSATKDNISIRYLGLFDADGWSQTLGTRASEDSFAASVEPGEAGYDTTRSHHKGSYWVAPNDDNITNLFGTSFVYDVCYYNADRSSDKYYPKLAETNTWASYVVRLTNGAPAIATYDWANTYGWTSGNKGGFHWTPCAWSLEGSVDGIHWENVKPDGGDYSITTNDCPAVAYDAYFIRSGAVYNNTIGSLSPSSPIRHSGGYAIRGTSQADYPVLCNVRSVNVVNGATLEADGPLSLSNLTVDAGDSTGTIKGFSFAYDCTVNVTNAGSGLSVELPLVLADVPGGPVNTAGWQVKVNGETKPAYTVRVDGNGRLSLCRPGTLLTVR